MVPNSANTSLVSYFFLCRLSVAWKLSGMNSARAVRATIMEYRSDASPTVVTMATPVRPRSVSSGLPMPSMKNTPASAAVAMVRIVRQM